MPARPVFAAGVDAGSQWTRCVILLMEDARVRLLGYAGAPSQGWYKGRIADQKAVSESILRAVREAEAGAQTAIGSAVFGIGGSVCGTHGRGGYEIGFPRQIDQNDVNRVVERASRVQLQEDEMVLHLTPQDFTVDGRPGHRNPRGMIGSRLEVYVHLVTGSRQEHYALVGAANEAHLVVEETVFEPLAAAYASILPEERREGCVVVDIGAHSTDLAAYYGEALLFSTSLPICGDHFTRDVARGLRVNGDDAAWIKEQYGCALLGLGADNSLIELPAAPGRPAREAPCRELNMILEARALELFEFVAEELKRIGLEQMLMECVLTGGGARLQGMCDAAERVLKCQARIGLPVGILDWPGEIDDPAWTAAAGLAMYSARLKLRAELDRRSSGFFAKVLGA
ncbi:MAG: cell division protein FtsA [Rhodospirillales bacterium]